MLRIALKGLMARKLRLILTSTAIVFGVSVAVASFVLTDSLRATFGTLSTDVNSGNDLVVRQKVAFGERGDTLRVPAALEQKIRGVPGVEQAEGQIFAQGAAVPVDGTGKAVETKGPPLATANWGTADKLTRWFLIDGRKPAGVGEFALSADTADDYDFVLGTDYTLITPAGPVTSKLVGFAQFTEKADASVGAVFVLFDNAATQTITGMSGQYQEIWVNDRAGADRAEVQAAIEALLPADLEVITNEVAEKEFSDSFNSIIDGLGIALQVFAFVIVFVSAFLINNTFNIIIGQRIRELGLLRALGATGKQVRRSVLAESLMIGTLATAVSLGIGVLFALGLRALFRVLGFPLPYGPIELRPRTIVAAIVVGVGSTMVASIFPALKASRIPPIAALRDEGASTPERALSRTIVGAGALLLGVVLAGFGLFGSSSTVAKLILTGGGALIIFVAVATLSPLIARPAARFIGSPLPKMYGTTGSLARENSARSPRRTASTASALMIGIALVCMVAVVAQSLKTTFKTVLETGVAADYAIAPANGGGPQSGFSSQLARDLATVPGVSAVVPIRQSQIRIDGDTKSMAATNFAQLDRVFDMRTKRGGFTGAPKNAIALHTDAAKKTGANVGDTIQVEFQGKDAQPFTVVAVFQNNKIFNANYLIDLAGWDANLPSTIDAFVVVRVADGQDAKALRPVLATVVDKYPPQELQTKEEFRKSQEKQLGQLLNIINVFLFLSVLVALIGIVNTLTLSIFERTRELGLLRAIGMDRRQLRRMIRWEAVVIALFGGVLGAVMGIVFGIGLASAIPDSIVSEIDVPVVRIVIYVVLSGVAGLAAAIFPARRASKLDVLDAISYT